MKPSKCKICGIAEWNHVCGGPVPAKGEHVSGRSFKFSKGKPAKDDSPEVAAAESRSLYDGLEARVTRLEALVEELMKGPSEARRKYMRNYMKKRRGT